MPVTATRREAQTRSRADHPQSKPAELFRYFNAKLAAEWGPHDLKKALDQRKDEVLVLDVRHREGFREGHIPGAKNIPLQELDSRLKELSKDQEIVTYCWNVTCSLCTQAAAFLASKGFRVRELVGGIAQWQAAGFPVERS